MSAIRKTDSCTMRPWLGAWAAPYEHKEIDMGRAQLRLGAHAGRRRG